jgi:16S rRNA (guanine966-N2)-methyltransferase
MRIVGGRLKGRVLKGPTSNAIRPTSDRLRETLFNILAHAYGDPVSGARVIDLFSGTGAFAFEALSRGAAFAHMVDESDAARSLIRANAETLGLGEVSKFWRKDARKLGAAPQGEIFTLSFLDPPYGLGLAEPALASLAAGSWLSEGALVIVEEHADAAIQLPEGFSMIETRRYDDTRLVFLKYSSAANPLPEGESGL